MTAKTWNSVIGIVVLALAATLFFQYQEMDLYGVADKISAYVQGLF